jgi:non-specific protein-tyrosine kinase
VEIIEYLATLRRRWRLIVLAVVVCTAASAWVTARQTRIYSTSIKFYVSSTPATDVGSALTASQLSQQRIGSYADLVQSRPYVDQAVARSGRPGPRPRVVARPVPQTVLLYISVEDPDPARAAAVANAFGQVFPALVDSLDRPVNGTSPVHATVVESAVVPTEPISPHPKTNIAFGLLLGLLVGGGAALLISTLDHSVKTTDELERLSGANVLGVIPHDPKGERLVAQVAPRSTRAEAFRQIRTNVQFASIDDSLRSIVVTSPLPAEGKSTVVANLAITLAHGGQRVLVVDADLRRPSLGQYFGVESSVGLTNLLLGTVSLQEAVQSWAGGLLHVLPSGPVPPNPAEVLGSHAMLELIMFLEDRYDVVLFDSAPVVPVTDAALLAANTNGAVLVVRLGRTTREQLGRAIEILRMVDVRVIGTVANWVTSQEGRAYHYTYRHTDEIVSSAAFPRERLRLARRRGPAPPPAPMRAAPPAQPLVGQDPSLRRAPGARTISRDAAADAMRSSARTGRWQRQAPDLAAADTEAEESQPS